MASATQPQLFETGEVGRNSVDSNLGNKIQYQYDLDSKEAKKWGDLYKLVRPTADIKEMHRNLTTLSKKDYPIQPHSKMNKKEVVDYYRAVRNDLATELFEAEYTLSLRDYPEKLMYN